SGRRCARLGRDRVVGDRGHRQRSQDDRRGERRTPTAQASHDQSSPPAEVVPPPPPPAFASAPSGAAGTGRPGGYLFHGIATRAATHFIASPLISPSSTFTGSGGSST